MFVFCFLNVSSEVEEKKHEKTCAESWVVLDVDDDDDDEVEHWWFIFSDFNLRPCRFFFSMIWDSAEADGFDRRRCSHVAGGKYKYHLDNVQTNVTFKVVSRQNWALAKHNLVLITEFNNEDSRSLL